MSEGGGLTGDLDLVCDLDERGLTRLRRQSFRAPFHLSKPYHDGGALVLNVINPTAGLLDGDRLRSDVRVEGGARFLLTTPSASRVHTMRGGNAEVVQNFAVEAGGSLEVWPEMLIPQRGARYIQRTAAALAQGAEFLYYELLAPGRAASGEIFAFDELCWMTDVRLGGRLIARERYRLAPAAHSLDALRRSFPHAYYASAILASPTLHARRTSWDPLLALHGDTVWLGISALDENAFILKLVAADSLVFRRAMRAVRAAVYDALGRPAPGLRRAGDPVG